MPLRFSFQKVDFEFITPAKTSRNTLFQKPSYFLKLENDAGKLGIGECSLIPQLSPDSPAEIESCLNIWSSDPYSIPEDLSTLQHLPALRFGMEMMTRSFHSTNAFELFPTSFTSGNEGILMNGLIWMDSFEGVLQQIQDRSDEGFRIIKMKVGAGDFQEECRLLKAIRERFPSATYELRLDANGAFDPENALNKLETLAQFDIHSIEQPIKPKHWRWMREISDYSPIPIALDEELIANSRKELTLDSLRPQYIILKPSLIGGFQEANEWVQTAQDFGIRWWATSALESNIGLNAIAQWCANSLNPLPQGLGTGRLYTQNVSSPLEIRDAHLWYGNEKWSLNTISPV